MVSKPANVCRAVWKLPKPSPRQDKALDTPMVLLDDGVEVFALPQTGAAP
jgi:hypothetical protein